MQFLDQSDYARKEIWNWISTQTIATEKVRLKLAREAEAARAVRGPLPQSVVTQANSDSAKNYWAGFFPSESQSVQSFVSSIDDFFPEESTISPTPVVAASSADLESSAQNAPSHVVDEPSSAIPPATVQSANTAPSETPEPAKIPSVTAVSRGGDEVTNREPFVPADVPSHYVSNRIPFGDARAARRVPKSYYRIEAIKSAPMSRVLVAAIAFIVGSGLALLILFGFLDFMKAGIHRGLNLIDAHHPDSVQNETKRTIAPRPPDIFPQDPPATPRASTLPPEQEPEKPLSQSKGNLLARPSPLTRPEEPNPARTESSPISPSIQETPGVPVGYVASNSHFLSIRTPAASREDGPQANGAVHIGQPIYSPQAIYPEQALRLHEEGIVKVLVIVGLDGSVMRVASASGPPALVPCALRAVRDWRYASTLIGEKPVETEQEITFVFRQ